MMSRSDSRHWKISTGRHFQNGHHNTAQIQHCPISDIRQCWIFAVLWRPFWKWRPVEFFQCRESIRDSIIYPHIKWCSCRLKGNNNTTGATIVAETTTLQEHMSSPPVFRGIRFAQYDKGVIRRSKLKEIRYHGKKEKVKTTNNNLQNST
jgi:hypothetical protein